MRKSIFILTIMFVSLGKLYSQNCEPDTMSFTFYRDDGSSFNAKMSDKAVPQNHILLGWQWGGMPIMTSKLLMNSNQGYEFRDTLYSSTFIPSVRQNYIAAGWVPTVCQSMEFSAALKSVPDSFVTIPGDPWHNIFGFQNIKGEIQPTQIQDPTNFHRLILKTTGSYVNDTVLSNPWMDNQYLCYDQSLDTNYKYNWNIYLNKIGWDGQHWYLSINLRRLDSLDNSSGNDTILAISMPALLSDNSNWGMKFDSIPDINNNIHLNDNGDRGYVIDCKSQTLSKIYITKNMIPPSGSPYGHDITINAHFKCNNDLQNNNYFLNPGNGSDPFIKNLKIAVKYYGRMNIALDWIRISTDKTQNLFYGVFDNKQGFDTPNNAYSLDSNVQLHLIDTMHRSKSFKFFRIYAGNGYDASTVSYWGALRYFNKIFGGLTVNSSGAYLMKHFDYYVGHNEIWANNSALKKANSPCFSMTNHVLDKIGNNYVYDNRQFLNRDAVTKSGYRGFVDYWDYHAIPDCSREKDTLNSLYETWLAYGDVSPFCPNNSNLNLLKTLRDSTLDYYWYVIANSYSLQPIWERCLYNAYYLSPYYLYNMKPWWNQVFIGAVWNLVPFDTSKHFQDRAIIGDNLRPNTGEEINLMDWAAIIRGAKGLCYDRESGGLFPDSSSHPQNAPWPETGAGYGPDSYKAHENDPNFIYLDEIGEDFVKTTNDSMHLDQYLDFNVFPKVLGIKPNRLYVGIKSNRLALYKVHSWITQPSIDSILMRLRLACQYSKGFRVWYNQDNQIAGDTLLYRFLSNDITKWHTRPVGRTTCWQTQLPDDPGVWVCGPYYEPWDSTFADVTLLRDSSDHFLSQSHIWMGVQNRRTDPLIHTFDTISGKVDPSMRFYSTAEFDDSCRYSKDSLTFRKLIYSRLGAREITIPYNFKSGNTAEYCLLHVHELGKGTSLDNDTSAWWFREPYNQRVDTIIGQDRAITMNLLPGQGNNNEPASRTGKDSASGYSISRCCNWHFSPFKPG